MCGVIGMMSHEDVAAELYDGLIHLQHRGQDAAGIVTSDGRLHEKKGLGLVRGVFTANDIFSLKGKMGIAHVRYPTTGGYNETDVQPISLLQPKQIALAHNGNLVDYQAAAASMEYRKQTTLDSEVLLNLLARELSLKTTPNDLTFLQVTAAIKKISDAVTGSYSVVAIVPGLGLIAFRDPHGIRPLVWGERKQENGKLDYIFASETTPFYALGFEPRGDLLAGEVALVTEDGEFFRKVINAKEFAPCVFEYVYFSRPDATLDNVSVYRARLRMGQNLANSWKEHYPDVVPDVVIPAPFTANTAALSFANALEVRYSEGLYKNPFIGRTFIMPNQKARAQSVRYKLSPQRTEIENKNVLILDDSIVRGTTSREIVKMVREFGAKKIYFVSTSPPIMHPCFYGIDMPSHDELIAATHSLDQIRDYLGVDLLLYQTEEDLIEAVTRKGDHHIKQPCMACMNGRYICGNLSIEKIHAMTNQRILEKA